jgi:hypothetical protein
MGFLRLERSGRSVHKRLNQQGYHLLEITLGIALLSIVLLAFAGFFLQAKIFNSDNEERGSAAQLSQEILHIVKKSPYSTDLTIKDWNLLYGSAFSSSERFYIEVGEKRYYPDVKIMRAESFNDNLPDDLNLVVVSIQEKEADAYKTVYETFGYKE